MPVTQDDFYANFNPEELLDAPPPGVEPTSVEGEEGSPEEDSPSIFFSEDSEIPFNKGYEFITGPAGSGKTYEAKKRKRTILTATTGIASVNLGEGCRTINSLLGFYNLSSLQESIKSGKIISFLHRMKRAYPDAQEVVTDEVSMLSGEMLTLLHEVFQSSGGLKWTVIGDFAQLPPIGEYGMPASWAFESPRFKHFKQTKLSKIWRQSDPDFITALNLARVGDGQGFLETLGDRLQFVPQLTMNEKAGSSDSCIIMAKNATVDNWNSLRLKELPGDPVKLQNITWGKPASDWKDIPPALELKVGAKVLTLSNNYDAGYVNGSMGTVIKIDPRTVWIKLQTGTTVAVLPKVSYNLCEEGMKWKNYSADRRTIVSQGEARSGRDRLGEVFFYQGMVTYWPLRLAWATSNHRSQGLTLDRVTVNLLNQYGQPEGFFRAANMAYVALSRCKTLEGMTIVGTPALLEAAIKVDQKVKQAGLL